ncbi:carbohydrate ABC transporter substrate-binding protein (CUT1 family) [Neobacillus bataviensis]|uniref:Carbohydrate ABC transporter substrate-binding protein (CUT1 family) n=1 Tax=Neobacillus bataviensis TaxID=220685 RepID=A0A561E0E9_9BACI|nr:extracellular solute-binding protein [Neobacillus bataviensis]TWE09118.1 carbohydrate ABC transporter substrate-binding protein (CUT1 family) [Neobacillus bataviensis]
MKKRMLASVSSLLLVGGLLAGCSSKDSSTAADTSKDGKIQISVWSLQSQDKTFLNSVYKDFEKENPKIDLKVNEYTVDSMKEALKVAASSNTMPDTWFTWGGSLGSFYPENGLAADLTDIAKKDNWDQKYNKAAIDLTKVNGKIYGVPYHLNSMGMFYNKEVYQKAGLSAPKTFDEFESQLQKLKDSGVTPLTVGGKSGWMLMRFTEQLIEHYAGPQLHDQLNTMEASWNDPAVVKSFAKLKEWSDKGYFPKGFISIDPTELETTMYQGKGALALEGTWFDGNVIDQGLKADNFDFFSFPSGQTPERMSSFVEMFQVNSNLSKEKQAAVIKFLEFVSGKNEVNKFADKYGSAAALGITYPDTNPHVSVMADQVKKGNFLISDQALPQQVVQALFEAQDKVVLGQFTPKQAAQSIQSAIKDYKANNAQ